MGGTRSRNGRGSGCRGAVAICDCGRDCGCDRGSHCDCDCGHVRDRAPCTDGIRGLPGSDRGTDLSAMTRDRACWEDSRFWAVRWRG